MQFRRIHTPYLQKCFACGRAGHDMFSCNVNGQQYLVCSPDHGVKLKDEANKKVELDASS